MQRSSCRRPCSSPRLSRLRLLGDPRREAQLDRRKQAQPILHSVVTAERTRRPVAALTDPCGSWPASSAAPQSRLGASDDSLARAGVMNLLTMLFTSLGSVRL